MTASIRLLLRGGSVVTGIGADGVPEVVTEGAVLIAGNVIERVGSFAELRTEHPDLPVIGSSGDILTPGFVNAHHHVGLTPFQLGVPDLPLELWLGAKIGQRQVDPYLDTLYSAFELIASGVTTVQHLHVGRSGPDVAPGQAEAILRAYRDIGLRASYSFGYRDQNRLAYEDDDAFLSRLPVSLATELTPWFEGQHFPLGDYIGFVDDLAGRHDPKTGRLAVQLAPANLHWCSDQALATIGELSRRRQLPMHLHLLETPEQAAYVGRRTDRGAIDHLHHLGLLGPLLTLGHCVWLKESELDRIAETQTCICHNASSNLRLGSGRAPCRHFLDRGIAVAIGIDEAGINDDRDMLQEMRLVRHLHKGPGKNGVSAAEAFAMATEHGAATTPFRGRIGRLAPGMAADVVFFDRATIAGPYLDTAASPVDAIVHRGKSASVKRVMIDGRVVYEDGRFLTIDRDTVLAELSAQLSTAASAEDEVRRRLAERLVPHLASFYAKDDWRACTDRLEDGEGGNQGDPGQ